MLYSDNKHLVPIVQHRVRRSHLHTTIRMQHTANNQFTMNEQFSHLSHSVTKHSRIMHFERIQFCLISRRIIKRIKFILLFFEINAEYIAYQNDCQYNTYHTKRITHSITKSNRVISHTTIHVSESSLRSTKTRRISHRTRKNTHHRLHRQSRHKMKNNSSKNTEQHNTRSQ